MIFSKPIVPGETLLFLNEIQSCPEAIKRLWFFKEDFPKRHIVAAGSLLEFALKDLSSFGVGRIRSLFMYPMSFDELLVKYSNPRSQHDLYYWENIANGTSSEVDYVIVKDTKVMPIECKAGTSGKMKSLHLFMRNKHLNEAYRCSLENFALLEDQDIQDDNAIRRTLLILYMPSRIYVLNDKKKCRPVRLSLANKNVN